MKHDTGNDRWDALMTRQANALTDYEARCVAALKTKGTDLDDEDTRYDAAEWLVRRIEKLQPHGTS